MNIQEFASEVASIYGNQLESIILYGSAADGEFHKGHSDYNTIVVLKELAPADIARGNKLFKKWVNDKNPLPLFFTQQIIKDASDVFPIEFSDIKEQHKTLYGYDPFQDIKIDQKNLRHQCEHEFRSKLLVLVQRLAILADRPKELIRLILESSSSFFAIFRGALRLAGIRPEASKRQVIEQISKLTDSNMTIFTELLDAREGKLVWQKENALEKFEQYLTSLNAVVRFVDRF